MHHRSWLDEKPRMAHQAKNLMRLSDPQKRAVVNRAEAIRRGDVGRLDPA